MCLFVLCIAILYFISFFSSKNETFGKGKTTSIRGLMAILIVFHHLSLQGIAGLNVFHSWGAPVVSIFFFISGYGLFKNFSIKGRQYLSGFLEHRIFINLLLPFIIALVIYCSLNWKSIPRIDDALIGLIFQGYTILPHSWYVFAILILYFIFYITAKFLKERFFILGIVLFCIFYIIWCLGFEYDRCWYISILAFPFGIIIGKYENVIYNFWNRKICYYITVPLCLAFIAFLVYMKNEYAYMIVYLFIPFIFMCLFVRAKVEKLCKLKFIAFISGISYEIYLCQGISMELLRGDKFYVKYDLVYILLTFLLTFAISYFVKLLKNKIASNFL